MEKEGKNILSLHDKLHFMYIKEEVDERKIVGR